MGKDELPFSTEDLISSAVEALKVSGDARAIAILVAGRCFLERCDHDWGTDYWRLSISLPVHVFYTLTKEDRTATEDAILEVMQPFFVGTPEDGLASVVLNPSVISAQDGWREDALRFVKGEGVTNQGRVRSDNIASKNYQGLLFRSKAEITLFSALTRAQLAVAPLPVFIRIGNRYNRLEPDFIVIYKGLTFIVEVDGDTYHNELPAEADKRLVPLTYEGVEVRRIRAADLDTDKAADQVVKELIGFMTKRKESR